ncbi:hypothetical protein C0989_008051 [Termitomyces sp. Mn162]|nr:hypothetical protein C0989_008051 [Termitomyces sp. Mn162]
MYNPKWALEMIERSRGTYLIVKYDGMFEGPRSPQTPTSYAVLSHVFKSHFSRVKSLVLRLRFAMNNCNLDNSLSNPFHQERRLKESSTRLLALAQQTAPLMKHLELLFEPSEENMFPNNMVMDFSNLDALILEGCGMDWGLIGLRNIKTLSLSYIPAGLRPSMIQLLGILSQTPFLETLKIADLTDPVGRGISSLVPISLVHLEHIELSCDLPSCVLFFDTILFSGKASRIELEHTVLPTLATLNYFEISVASMKRLAWRIQDGVEGLLLKLMLREKMLCLKSRLGVGSEPTTRIEIDLREHGEFLIALGNAFWQSLRIDQLEFLEVEDFKFNTNVWMMFGDLPHLEELFVRSNECPLLEVLSCGIEVAQTGAPGPRPSFVALKRLTTFGWALHKPGSHPGETIAMQMVNCFKFRRSAGLHLESLVLEESRKANNTTLAELRKVIGEVYGDSDCWNSSAGSESETESSEWETVPDENDFFEE